MAACEITIELDEPDRVFVDGEPVRGQVIVSIDKDTNCKSLVLDSGWITHGRGNVTKGKAGTQTLYSGPWQAGQQVSYRFELPTSTWPPTYYGNLLNISHQLTARAKVAWAFDPKATLEIPVLATQSPAESAPASPSRGLTYKVIGWILGAVVIALVGLTLTFLLPILLIAAAAAWFFTSYLPKSVTGDVTCSLSTTELKAGQTLTGTMEFTPKRESKINGVTCTVTCREICVSGSGTKATTHRHEMLSRAVTLLEPGVLLPGEKQHLPFDFPIASDAPPSIELTSNRIEWTAEFRVDIPRWPDYKQKFNLTVAPSGTSHDALARVTRDRRNGESAPADWLREVVEQIVASEDDRQRLNLVLEAVRDHEFEVQWQIDFDSHRPPRAESVHGGHWFEGHDPQREFTFYLHCSSDDFKPQAGEVWNGHIRILDFDPDSNDLIVTAVR